MKNNFTFLKYQTVNATDKESCRRGNEIRARSFENRFGGEQNCSWSQQKYT